MYKITIDLDELLKLLKTMDNGELVNKYTNEDYRLGYKTATSTVRDWFANRERSEK